MKLYGLIKNGVYPFGQALRDALASFDGKEIIIEIIEKKKRRSVNQERFYRGVILLLIRDFESESRGKEFTLEAVHLHCKILMGRTRYEELPSGEWQEVAISNADKGLSTKRWEEDLEKLRAHYAQEENGGLQIPLPNEIEYV